MSYGPKVPRRRSSGVRPLATEGKNKPRSTNLVKREEFMKKAKRKKSRSSPKRAGTKRKANKATKAKRSATSKSKSLIPKRAGAKLKHVAKKAAVAAGMAAVGTALSELAPEQKGSESETPNETEPKHERSRR
jgi:hypothetical protein